MPSIIYATLLIVSATLTSLESQVFLWIEQSASDVATRPMRRFAEEEIVLPRDGGPHEGERFSCDFQPFTRLFFDAIDSGRWPRIAATGPTQTGKTLICHVIPICHGLFERGENVVDGIPDMNMAHDKWQQDFEPIIDASPFLRALRPVRGEGSKGGRVKSAIRFRNGATLRFMSAGSRDTGRAGFTARTLAATEIDNFPKRSEASQETDRVSQLEGRLRATKLREKRIFLECTVTTEAGRIWVEYQNGTASRIVVPCPLCKAWTTPEREHLKGWQEAESEWEAFDATRWHCPACNKPWTEAQREEMNHRAVLVHRGQEVTPDGRVVGDPPPVFTFGFRWNAFNNLFLSAGDVGLDEWSGRRSSEPEDAERKLCQQVHCIPYDSPEVDLAPFDPKDVAQRPPGCKRGIVPKGAVAVTVGVDTGKRQCDWTAIAWLSNGTGHVIDYGEFPVDWQRLGTKAALVAALRKFAVYCTWQREEGGEHMPASQVWIDSGYHEHTDAVYEFCRQANQALGLKPGQERFRPTKGHGACQRMLTRYSAPKATSSAVRYIGREYHLSQIAAAKVLLVHVNADHWKLQTRERFSRPADEPGALVLFEAQPGEHDDFLKQLAAEEPKEIYEPGKGEIVVWVRVRRKNHKLDSTYQAVAAGDYVLVLLARARQRAASGKWWAKRKRGRR